MVCPKPSLAIGLSRPVVGPAVFGRMQCFDWLAMLLVRFAGTVYSRAASK